MSQESHSNGDSGANTPSHLSQQSLIKIMKKIKGTSIQATADNKENLSVAPPNIITSQLSRAPACADSLYPSGTTTPTEPAAMHGQNLFSKQFNAG